MIRRTTLALALAGSIAAGGVASAANGGLGLGAARAASVSVATTLNVAPSALATRNATVGLNHGAHGAGFAHGMGRGFTVKGVSGNTITVTGRRGQSLSVQVTSGTTFTRAGATAALSEIQAGTIIAVQGTSSSTGTIAATGITILLPMQGGVVTSVEGNSIAVTGFDGVAHMVTVDAGTRYEKAGQSAALSDIAVGTALTAEGTQNKDGSLTAVRVTIRTPRAHGQVSGVNGTTFTIADRDGTTITVAASASTTYTNADGTSATAAAVKTGLHIEAEGSLSSDGKTLTAVRITIEADGGRRGRDGSGGPGGRGDGPGSDAPGASGAVTSGTAGATF